MDAETKSSAPAWLVESLELSRAQIAAGETVPLEPALDRLRASIAWLEAKRAAAEHV
jgi:hypothetical protein